MEKPLNVALFGATGMVGSAVLAHLLADDDVASVLSIGRRSCGVIHPKLKEALLPDLADLSPLRDRVVGLDACFFTLGVSSVGLSEAEYTRSTYDLTIAAAKLLLAGNPGMSFCYVSGQGTDSDGKMMWAQVKGRTENELLALPFAHAGMIRLGMLAPSPGFKPKTGWIRLAYAVLGPLIPLFKRLGMPVLDGPTLGRAMLRVAQGRAPKRILEPRDLLQLGG